jgi:CRP-like cAMP-binding protein
VEIKPTQLMALSCLPSSFEAQQMQHWLQHRIISGGTGRQWSSPLKACDGTREDLSQLIGSSRETVTRTLSEVRKMGIVELKGSTLIVRNKAAVEICGGLAA